MNSLDKNNSFNKSEKLSFSEKLAFGGGNIGATLVMQTISSFLMFFYTDVYKISAVAAGTLFLVARVLDSIVDFSMGYLVDKTKSRWGKFRPYVMFGCLPLCVLGVLCFTVPDFNDTGKLIYAYVTYLLVMVLYSVVTIPCTAILPSITQDPDQRVKINNYPQFLGMAALMFVVTFTMPLVEMLGGGNQGKGFFTTMVIYCSIALLLFIVWSMKVRERIIIESKEELTLKEALPTLFKNKYLLLLVGTFVFYMSGFTIRNTVQMYYLIYSVKRPDLIPTVGLLSMLPLIIIILLVPFLVGKIGKKNSLMIGIAIVLVSNIGQYFVSFDNITMIYVLTVTGGIGGGLFVPLVWGMLPDTVDYADWKFGKRTEGIISSTFIFAQKAASGLAGYIAGIVLVFVGYIPNAAQSAETMKGISFLYNIAGAILTGIALVFMLFYDLDAKKYNKIIEDLHKRIKKY